MNQLLKERISDAMESLQEELTVFAQEIVRIPTENPPGRCYPECAEAIGNMMKKIGMEVEMIQVPGERLSELAPLGERLPRVSVLGKWVGPEKSPVIHFTGHYDVVPAGTGWTHDPFSGKVLDGRLYGRGSSDQKSGVVSQIFAIYALKKAGISLKGTVISSSTPDEETGGFAGLGYLVEQGIITKENTQYCVITECLDVDKICLGHRGTIWFEVITKGKQSHGSMPSEGINAIVQMQRFLNAVDREIQPQLEVSSVHPIMPPACRKSTLTVTMIKAGNKINTVPNECVASFDWRLIPEQDVAWALEELKRVMALVKEDYPDFEAELRVQMEVNPTLVPDDTPVVKAFQTAGRDILGETPAFSVSPGSDDQKFVVQQAGIEQCIVYGPGPLTQAHKSNEYVPIRDMMEAAKVMALSMVELLGVVPAN